MHSIFEKGCLIQLSTSVWGAKRKIQNAYIEQIGASPEWLNANKKLIDAEALKPIHKIVSSARIYLAKMSLPFPLPAMVLVPKEMLSAVDYTLGQKKEEFEHAVQAFLAEYPSLRNTAAVHLEKLFNETDYPVDVSSKFAFSWRFITIDVPNGNAKILAPEVYEAEKLKFIQTMDEAREMAVLALREEFSSLVERIADRFTNDPDGKNKIFKNGTINNFYEYFETFKQRNIFDDAQLDELVQRAQELLGGKSAESIREDDRLKDRIKFGMESIEERLESLIGNSRRRVIMD